MADKKYKVLIVEDLPETLRLLAEKFTIEGFDVLEAKNGEEGLKKALENHPDIMLLDLILPKMDGLTMFKKMREDARGKDIPAIVLTILSDAEKVDEALQAGVYTYLVKTEWTLDDVVKKVREKLASGKLG